MGQTAPSLTGPEKGYINPKCNEKIIGDLEV